MNPTNIKRSIVLNGHKTSVSLERDFWESLRQTAALQNAKLTKIIAQIDQGRNGGNLSSAIRVFLFNHLRTQLAIKLRMTAPVPAKGKQIFDYT